MNINVNRFRIFSKTFRVLEILKRNNPARFQKIVVQEETSKNAKPFEMALPFRVRNPKRNFQVLEDATGKALTHKESLELIRKDKLNAFE